MIVMEEYNGYRDTHKITQAKITYTTAKSFSIHMNTKLFWRGSLVVPTDIFTQDLLYVFFYLKPAI